MSQVEQWKGWREDNIGKLKSLSAARPRDMRLKVRIKEFEAAEGGEIERLGQIINREYSDLSTTTKRV